MSFFNRKQKIIQKKLAVSIEKVNAQGKNYLVR